MDRQQAIYVAIGCELIGLALMVLLTRALQMPFSLGAWLIGLGLLLSGPLIWLRYRN